MKFPIKYIPSKLTKRDKKKQKKNINKSKKLYKKGLYFERPKVKSYKSKTSQHVKNAMKIYGINKVVVNKELSKKTGCSISALNKIIKKGQGAYYSSGSRPNQTATSWGVARLASAITGGKSAAVDFNILETGCKNNSKALKLAKTARKKHKYGTRKVRKVSL